MNIVLIGMQGVGKTTCGKLLAEKLRRVHIDTDALLVERFSAHSVRALYTALGQSRFRLEEKKLVTELQVKQNTVLSLGGGFVLMDDALSCIPSLGHIVHLSVERKTLYQDPLRFLQGAFLKEHSIDAFFEKRMALYRALCHYQIPVDNATPSEVVTSIVQKVL